MPLTPARLKRLVSYRERLEKLQEQQLGLAMAAHQERVAAFEAANAEKTGYLDSGAPLGTLDIYQLAANQAYSTRLDRLRDSRRAALNYSQRTVDRERETLLAKSRDRKAMELLLERRLAEERLLARREETKMLDEAAVSRWTTRD